MPKISQQATSNDYTAACTIQDIWGGNGGSWQVDPSGGGAYIKLQWGQQGQGQWTEEFPANAGASGILEKGTTGVAFRSFTAGTPATVTAALALPRQPAFQVVAFGTPSVAVTFLGRFTQTQWPPSNPATGDVAVLADTVNGADFILQYSTATGKWTPYNGDPLAPAVYQTGEKNSGGSGTWLDLGSFTIQVAGSWNVRLDLFQFSGATLTAGLGTTAAAHDIATSPTTAHIATIASAAYTFTVGEVIHVSGNTNIAPAGGWAAVAQFSPASL